MSCSIRFLAFTLFALLSPAVLAADDAAVRAAIEAVNAGFMKGVESRSAASMAASYEENARLIPPNEAEVVGKTAIELYWQGMLDHGVTDADFVIEDVHTAGDMAVERGHVDLRFADPKAPPATVRYLVMWQRQPDGAWKIRYDIWNDAPKPPAAAQPEATAPAAGG